MARARSWPFRRHDERDYAFAKTFDLPIIEVVSGGDISQEAYTECQHGKMVNSGFLDGMEVSDAIPAIIDFLVKKGIGERKVNYKLRDWVFSRQRYWGEPIPLVSLREMRLGADSLRSVAAGTADAGRLYADRTTAAAAWPAPRTGSTPPAPSAAAPRTREADTMPNWAGSSWYFLRYTDAHNDKEFASREALDYWSPVDWYNGGMEHTTLHLLYSRFWHKFLFDLGLVPTSEPYMKRTSHGMVLGANGEKMSKSRGNVVNPDDYIPVYGADSFRTYIMFMGAFDQPIPWNEQGRAAAAASSTGCGRCRI
jgi:leucyl-tRNA synthetase